MEDGKECEEYRECGALLTRGELDQKTRVNGEGVVKRRNDIKGEEKGVRGMRGEKQRPGSRRALVGTGRLSWELITEPIGYQPTACVWSLTAWSPWQGHPPGIRTLEESHLKPVPASRRTICASQNKTKKIRKIQQPVQAAVDNKLRFFILHLPSPVFPQPPLIQPRDNIGYQVLTAGAPF
jgi:hypothetical protein